ncbi:MAG: electron transfer flavoprotein subunit beta/FixA family protein [Thermodesulfobacteriota bacterium]
MHIIVCVKQVPDMEAELHLDENSGWLDIPYNLEFKMNAFDEYAVEEAVRIKRDYPDTVIDVVSVGPERAREVLQRALGMGADRAIHIRSEDHISSLQVAELVGNNLGKKGFDLVLTGAMSEDNMQGLLAPLLAQKLQMPSINSVVELEIGANNGTVSVKRELEGGRSEKFQVLLPAVLSLQSGINTPRYPALSKLLQAKQTEFETFSPECPASGEKLLYLQKPGQVRKGQWLQGDVSNKAEQLLQILRQKNVLSC